MAGDEFMQQTFNTGRTWDAPDECKDGRHTWINWRKCTCVKCGAKVPPTYEIPKKR
jgi:hypothetical protein